MVRPHLFDEDPNRLAKKIGTLLAKQIVVCMQKKGNCILGIVGGRSIPLVLTALGDELLKVSHSSVNGWGTISLVWLDERIDHEKNFFLALPFMERMANEGIVVEQHPILALDEIQAFHEMSACNDAVVRLRGTFTVDVAVLSVGEDGHVASLFPNHPALDRVEHQYVLVTHSPKPPFTRVTVTVPVLQSADAVVLLFVGKEKRRAYDLFCNLTTPPRSCPAVFFREHSGLFVATSLPRR